MKVPCKTAVSWIVILFFLQATAHSAVRKSSHDKERDKEMEEQHRDKDRLEIQKLREAEQEKKLKQQEAVRKVYLDDRLQRHPAQLYNARIMGRYGMKGGKPVPFVTITGQVHDILDEKRILVYIPARKTDTATSTSPALVLVQLEKPQPLSKGEKFFITNVIEAGTHNYSKSDGTPVSVRVYREIPGITLKEFLQLRKDGYRFPEETTADALPVK
ncbi:MAG: hypothetical protein PHR77_17655 [Kiritimatiellae bacterium]|nr:hypothetical protein [Kiritimatiellia bacterium]MDD5522770.1 hypothetical protein [Kiritimatiellia bacterium]